MDETELERVRSLMRRACRSDHQADVDAAGAEISTLNQERLKETLIVLLNGADLQVRCLAAETFVKVDPVAAATHVTPLLEDQSSAVRNVAVRLT